MSQSSLFSSGSQLAPFVISSGLLRLSWNAIISLETVVNSKQGVRLSYKVHSVPFHGKDLKIIVFETQDHDVQVDLISSYDLNKENFVDFEFLCTQRNPLFSVNKTVFSLLHENHQILVQLKDEIISSTQLIVTGSGLAGSVASLFTIYLLDTIGSGKNRPLCITFGAFLIGDKKLQESISRSSTWNSCFLNVVSHKDPLPTLFITNKTTSYMPFGTFLLVSDEGSTSSENSEFILELLVAISSTHVQNQGFQSAEYGNIVESLFRKVICKDLTPQAGNINLSDSLLASISLQLLALGLTPLIQDTNILKKMRIQEVKFIMDKRTLFDPSRKLNVLKKDMAQLEWYKKKTKNQGIGYYDSFRNMYSHFDQDVIGFQKNLTKYWEQMVEEAEMKPQKEGSQFRTRWLYAGTNYRRMVEPLVIAEYYRDKGQDYVNKERSIHFKKLEEWLNEGNQKTRDSLNKTSKHNVESILTLDSCFWAHVEEALIACKEFKNEEAKNKLDKFENYVYNLLKNYAVSPEIFLPKSSYMSWWNKYKAIKGSSYDSTLASFMAKSENYKEYAEGTFDFLSVQ
ncbi:hypothetical protein Lal_00028000 [Lupinus albus]|uniref:Putative carboxylesterase n=1 Tax=Lupinus albus TaxID=3870 RepID=A0A6A4NND2_LUPAL|nr:putative carboxylesterase [Lupinus albus]KAF1859818.1 hypothetical protein Lal_00028000 [Lupinus albus]